MEKIEKYWITITHEEDNSGEKFSESVDIPDDTIDWKDDEKVVSLTVRFVKLLSRLFKDFSITRLLEIIIEVLSVIKEDTTEWKNFNIS